MALTAADYQRKRLAAGLSQGGVAARTGYTRPHVNRVENEKIKPSDNYERCFLAAVDGQGDGPTPLTIPASQAMKTLTDASPQLEVAIVALEQSGAILNRARHTLTRVVRCVESIDRHERGIVSATFDPATATDDETQQVLSLIERAVVELCLEYRLNELPRDGFRTWIMGMASDVDATIKRRGRP